MSRVLPNEALGPRRPHKPTEVHKAHVERVELSEKRREAIRYGKSVRNGDSSPDYTDEDPSEQDKVSGTHTAKAGDPEFDPIEDELVRDEAIRQALIKKIRKYDNRSGLDTLDTDELEVIWKGIDETRKAGKRKMFDYSAKALPPGSVAGRRLIVTKPANVLILMMNLITRAQHNHLPAAGLNPAGAQPPDLPHRRRSAEAHQRFKRGGRRAQALGLAPTAGGGLRVLGLGPAIRRPMATAAVQTSTWDTASGQNRRNDGIDTRTKKQKKNAERSKLGNYVGVERDLLDKAFAILSNKLYTKHPFPATQTYIQLIHEAWGEAKVALKIRADKYPIEKGHKETLRHRVNSSHGHLRDHVRDQMENCFPFHDGSMTKQKIIEEVKRLLPHGLHQKPGSEPKTGYYAHPWIKRVIFKAFFVGRSPIGTEFPDDWNPIPLKVVAIVCGIMAYLVEPWADGKPPEVEDRGGRGKGVPRGPRMSFADVETKYREQYKFIKDMAKNGQGDRRDILLYEMYTSCMKGSRVKRAAPDSTAIQSAERRDNRDMFVADQLSLEEQTRLANLKAAKEGLRSTQDAETEDEDEPATQPANENLDEVGGGSNNELGWGDTNADDDILASVDGYSSTTPAGTARRRTRPVLRALAASAPGLRLSPALHSPSGSSTGSRVQSPCPPQVAGNCLPGLRRGTNNAPGDLDLDDSTRDDCLEGPNHLAIKSVVSRLEVVIPVGTPSKHWKEMNEGLEIRNKKGPRAAGFSGRLKIRGSVTSASQP
ncbi:hypothetical protein RhiJN_11804 [Ceratobasidium sp. AG-Ba]|nr:hypothetical protein RhiJN_11804 [Ceratobasidium sp. AG-Ba]